MKNLWLTAGLLAFSSAAFAFGPGGDGRHGDGKRPDPEKMVERMSEKLDLDDGQQAALREIMEDAHAEHERLRARMQAHREAVDDKILDILNDEQRAEFEELKAERRERMQERRERSRERRQD